MKLKSAIVLSLIFLGSINLSNNHQTEIEKVIVRKDSFCTGFKNIGSDGGTGAETLSRFYDKCVINGKTYTGNIEVTYAYAFKDIINGKITTIESRLERGKKFLKYNLSYNDMMFIKSNVKVKIIKEKEGYESSTRIEKNNWEYTRIPVDYTIQMNGNFKLYPIIDEKL